MDAGTISTDAIKYPLSDFKKVLILGIITILSSLIIPGFFLLGYFLKMIKHSMADFSELPDFDEWMEMFVDGLKVFVVLFIYSLVPLILILLGVWSALLPMFTVPGSGSLFNLLAVEWTGSVALIGVILEMTVSFIIAIALANMAYHDEIGAAFRFKEIISKIQEIGGVDYLIWYVLMLIIAIVAYFISMFLIFPFIIGIIIVPLIIIPYLIMIFARSTALIYVYGGSDDYFRVTHKQK